MTTPISTLLDLIFPPRCAGCKRRGDLLCAACRATCRTVPDAANREQHRLLNSPFLVSSAGAFIFEGAIREAVHVLKYNRRPRMAEPLGDMLVAYLRDHRLTIDAIVPIPLHPERQRMRGFNQAQLLAAQLARRLDVPIRASELQRARRTSQQADLSRAQRRANVSGAFVWRGDSAAPRRVLLLDDVLTTGATIAAAAEALHAAGAREIHGIALARGL